MSSATRPVVLCTFAHPDDEAFGPGGSIAVLSQTHDVYVLCVTDGNDLTNTSAHELSKLRHQELLKSAQVLGVKEVFFLDFADGCLCNSEYHQVAAKVDEFVQRLQPEILLTFEPRGVSGHLDHIAVSMITSFVFYSSSIPKELWYFCQSQQFRDKVKSYFVYMPPGYQREEIDHVVDISPVWETKLQAMYQHQTQKADADRLVAWFEILPREEWFVVLKK